jgi:ferredoxin-NADP reductase
MQLTLVEKRQETADTKSFLFQPEGDFAWKAGEYLHYKLPHANPDERGIERYFSISTAPFEKRVMLTCRFAPKSSSFKRALDALPVGGKIESDSPEGDFVVEDASKPLVFIAGGIGITPFRSILLDLDSRTQQPDIVLLYANRTEDLPFRRELEAVAKRMTKLRIQYVVGDHRLDGNAIRNSVTDLVRRKIYVSGPEPMVESLDRTLNGLGISEAEIVNDFFPGYDWP